MRNQKETIHRDALRFSRPPVSVRGILIALVTGFVLYTTLAFVNYTIGGPQLRGNVESLVLPLPASLTLVFTIIYLTRYIGKMHEEQRPWYIEQFMCMGIGYMCAVLSMLIIGEGLGNSLLRPLVGWSLAGVFLVTSLACIFLGMDSMNQFQQQKERKRNMEKQGTIIVAIIIAVSTIPSIVAAFLTGDPMALIYVPFALAVAGLSFMLSKSYWKKVGAEKERADALKDLPSELDQPSSENL